MIDLIFNLLLELDVIVKNNFELAIIIYFAFSMIFFIFSLPGSVLIILSSSFFFGFVIGFLINIISIVMGSLVFFIFSKSLLNKYLNKYLNKFNNRLNKIIKKSSYEYLILLRLVFGIPLFVQNIFLSTLNISKSKFIISSFIGFTPYFLFFSFIGDQFSSLMEIKDFKFSNIFSSEFLLIFLFIILFLLFRIFYKFKN